MERRRLKKGMVDDLVLLTTLSEDAIVTNLIGAAKENAIYTWIGPVLISVNPFRQIGGLYSPELIRKYRGRYSWELAPHVYAVAEDTYRALMSSHLNQCILITGESGAGKTEAAKRVMEYVAAVSPSKTIGDASINIKDRLLQSNPILEAFGNAKTIRNNNSSRFGKFMALVFDFHGQPVGGRITNFLLEKPRVTTPADSERSFHVFYFLLAGASDDEAAELKLKPASEYLSLLRSGCLQVAGLDDSDEFVSMRHAMGLVGFTAEEQRESMRIVLAILLLLNIAFLNGSGAGKPCTVEAGGSAAQALQQAASLLGVESMRLEAALTHRTITAGAMESIRSPLANADECVETAHALAKATYARLFTSVVGRINRAIEPPGGAELTMGVLDIYGFEIFELNSFEQLCINYCNEKLQQYFIALTLKAEQEEYAREGIAWEDVDYFDNVAVCELIEGRRPAGVLALLDEECVIPKGDDEGFFAKLSTRLSAAGMPASVPAAIGAKATATPRGGAPQLLFTIEHYAGGVSYSARGLLEKNRDALYPDLLQCAGASTKAYVTGLFPEAKEKASAGKRPLTAGAQFRTSMTDLVTTLQKCAPHYIRTVKPNDEKKAGVFDAPRMAHQVRYLGLLENVRVRRAGYAFRQPLQLFADRFRVLSSTTWPLSDLKGDARAETEEILRACDLGSEAYQFGKTKIFIRKPLTLFTLEELRARRLHDVARMLQTAWRALLARKSFLELREQAQGIFAGQKRRRGSWALYFLGDYCRAAESAELTRTLAKHGEKQIYFADVCEKINRKKKTQARALIITGGALYTTTPGPAFKPTNRIALDYVQGIACSTFADGYFILRVAPGAPDVPADLLFNSVRKAEIITILTRELTRRGARLPLEFGDALEMRSKQATGLRLFGGPVEKRKLTFHEDATLGAQAALAELIDAQKETGPIAVRVSPAFGSNAPIQLSTPTPRSAWAERQPAAKPKAPPKPPLPPKPAGDMRRRTFTSFPTARAEHAFKAGGSDQLSFGAGQVLHILERSSDEWWMAELEGKVGLVPSNYVKAL